MLSKLPVPGRPANLDNGREGAGGGCLDICFSRLSVLSLLSPSLGDGSI